MKFHMASVALVLCLGCAVPALAQQRDDDEAQQQAQVEAVEGELLEVDTESRIISVQGPDGAKLQFSYTNETVITGPQEQTQGLATIEGTHVRVYFTRSNDTFTATRVVVEPE
jgi:hypothetical protein